MQADICVRVIASLQSRFIRVAYKFFFLILEKKNEREGGLLREWNCLKGGLQVKWKEAALWPRDIRFNKRGKTPPYYAVHKVPIPRGNASSTHTHRWAALWEGPPCQRIIKRLPREIGPPWNSRIYRSASWGRNRLVFGTNNLVIIYMQFV